MRFFEQFIYTLAWMCVALAGVTLAVIAIVTFCFAMDDWYKRYVERNKE